MERRRRDAAWNPPSRGHDLTALFAILAAVPLLLPLVLRFRAVVFALPALTFGAAAVRLYASAPSRLYPRHWRVLALAATFAAAASALALASPLAHPLVAAALYCGAAAAVLTLVAIGALCGRTIAAASLDRVADALLFDIVALGIGIFFVAIPGFDHGDRILTAVFVVDLAALAITSVATLAVDNSYKRRVCHSFLAACGAASIAAGMIARAHPNASSGQAAIAALMWAASGAALLISATTGKARAEPDERDESSSRWIAARVAVPLLAVLTFPVAALIARSSHPAPAGWLPYFSGFFVVTLALAFTRQAHLAAQNRLAAVRERRLSGELGRRNEELEALTALTATMTETLEEEPIIERGLSGLRIAARASSIALHTFADGELRLTATAGAWAPEAPLATRAAPSDWEPGLELRGGRQLLRLPLSARGHEIGMVTLMRTADDPFGDDERRLLSLLVAQLAIAIQNARDYCEKLDQATRDPLTGVYNRRFLYDALERELDRGRRAQDPTSLVLIDIDDFKQINDAHGHKQGDRVLCTLADAAATLTRPGDTFARIGGEEFALLLPATGQLDALLVAERLRRAFATAGVIPDRRVTISAGVATAPDDAASAEELAGGADAALYWAKRNGKNLCVVVAEVVVSDRSADEEPMMTHLHALVATLDAQHLGTRDHSEVVATYAVAIGERLGLARDRLVRLRRAGLLHDIGKIAVRSAVLAKPGKLTNEEVAEIRVHSAVGSAMVLHAGFPEEAAWVRHHHERVDGIGYPDGLAGDGIPLESRIIFVADAFEAMTSDRPYRAGMPAAVALEELRRCAGTQFDPRIVEVFAGLIDEDRLPVLARAGVSGTSG